MNKFDKVFSEIIKEDQDNISPEQTNVKETMLKGLAQIGGPERLITTYIQECEHQDGSEFWNNFKTPGEVFEDFARWVKFKLDGE